MVTRLFALILCCATLATAQFLPHRRAHFRGSASDYLTDLSARWYADANVSAEGTWPDAVGSLDMTLYGTASVSTATPGMTGAGAGDYAEAAHNAAFEPGSGPYSAMCWFRLATETDDQELLSKSASGSLGPFRLTVEGGYARAYFPVSGSNWVIWDGGTKNNLVAGEISTATWYHVAFTWDGSTVRTYLNGSAGEYGTLSGTLTNNSEPLRIGRLHSAFADYDIDGVIDDVRIYDAALSAAQVQQVYNFATGDH
jgi:hypothetical protein